MSAPRFTKALTGLCAAVNATHPAFPETHYQLHFSVKTPTKCSIPAKGMSGGLMLQGPWEAGAAYGIPTRPVGPP